MSREKDWFLGHGVDPAPLTAFPSWLIAVAVLLGIVLAAGVSLAIAFISGSLSPCC